jgi:hypothetical protein
VISISGHAPRSRRGPGEHVREQVVSSVLCAVRRRLSRPKGGQRSGPLLLPSRLQSQPAPHTFQGLKHTTMGFVPSWPHRSLIKKKKFNCCIKEKIIYINKFQCIVTTSFTVVHNHFRRGKMRATDKKKFTRNKYFLQVPFFQPFPHTFQGLKHTTMGFVPSWPHRALIKKKNLNCCVKEKIIYINKFN